MPSGVELQIRLQADNLAAYKGEIVAVTSGRSKLWTLVDAASDEPYENRVKGQTITDLDTKLTNVQFGTTIGPWVTLHNDYFATDAGIANVTTLALAIPYYRWRVSQFFQQFYYEYTGSYLNAAYVFPRYDLSFGTFARTSNVFTNGSVVNTTESGLAKVQATATSIIGGVTWTVTPTLKRSDDTTVQLSISFLAADALGTSRIFGEEFLTNNVSANATVIPLANTTQFKVAEPVLLQDSNNQEAATVASIQAGVSITLTAGTRWGYNTASSAKVTPLFKDVTACTGSGGTAGDTCKLEVAVDRAVSI